MFSFLNKNIHWEIYFKKDNKCSVPIAQILPECMIFSQMNWNLKRFSFETQEKTEKIWDQTLEQQVRDWFLLSVQSHHELRKLRRIFICVKIVFLYYIFFITFSFYINNSILCIWIWMYSCVSVWKIENDFSFQFYNCVCSKIRFKKIFLLKEWWFSSRFSYNWRVFESIAKFCWCFMLL